MGSLILRIGLLTLGLGLTEIAISALADGSPAVWILLPIGLLALVAGSAGLVTALIDPTSRKERP